MRLEIALQRLEIAEGTLRRHEPQLHQPARRVIDENQQRAGIRPILEPAMLRPIDLDELAQALPPQSQLMKPAPLLA
jgi:hypothetical protein